MTENLYLILVALGYLAQVRIALGDVVVAVEWLSFIVDHRSEGRAGAIRRPPVELDEAQRLLDDLGEQLPPVEFAAAVERGRGKTLDDVMSELLPNL